MDSKAKLAITVARVLQTLFAVVTLGLSVTLIKGQTYGSAPTQTIYAAFCGGLGIFIGIIGVAGVFMENLNKWIFVVLDVVTAVLCIAGAIALGVALGGHPDCNNLEFTAYNPICNGVSDIRAIDKNTDFNMFKVRCTEASADIAFLAFGAVAFVTTAAVALFGVKRGW